MQIRSDSPYQVPLRYRIVNQDIPNIFEATHRFTIAPVKRVGGSGTALKLSEMRFHYGCIR